MTLHSDNWWKGGKSCN